MVTHCHARAEETGMDLEEEFVEHRGPLIIFCYRMLGSLQDAEDAVQETYIRAWRAADKFEHRSSFRTWLYRIATRVCLDALQHSSRRFIPSALGSPGTDLDNLLGPTTDISWLEPLPDAMMTSDPAAVVDHRQSLRLAFIAALQHLPPRQRAVLVLREALAWPAADVAALLDTTPAAVNSSLQRARATLADLAPKEDQISEPDDPSRRSLLDQYAAAFETADLSKLERLLTEDVRWEMPPMPTWFSGRNDVLQLLATKLVAKENLRRMVSTSANSQPAFAMYHRGADGHFHAHSLQVLTLNSSQVSAILAFHHPNLFPHFGLPTSQPGR
ncbi:sigma-70 family RNA polymerase sigma factor [Kribbella sp. NPDC000426]|uniref:sigma-70 family RNA polymerase sigma factor n=1 Tax=Kribbella sp. NPDC000426 TaxID=3154255 RepID=UPI003329BF33